MRILLVVVSLFLAVLNYFTYQEGFKQGTIKAEANYIQNDQVDVIYKSEAEACNAKWSEGCSLGIVNVNGEVYYTLAPKNLVAKSVKEFTNGEELSQVFLSKADIKEYADWKYACEKKWKVYCGLHYFELNGVGVYQVEPKE